jgi:hypothetical protein
MCWNISLKVSQIGIRSCVLGDSAMYSPSIVERQELCLELANPKNWAPRVEDYISNWPLDRNRVVAIFRSKDPLKVRVYVGVDFIGQIGP